MLKLLIVALVAAVVFANSCPDLDEDNSDFDLDDCIGSCNAGECGNVDNCLDNCNFIVSEVESDEANGEERRTLAKKGARLRRKLNQCLSRLERCLTRCGSGFRAMNCRSNCHANSICGTSNRRSLDDDTDQSLNQAEICDDQAEPTTECQCYFDDCQDMLVEGEVRDGEDFVGCMEDCNLVRRKLEGEQYQTAAQQDCNMDEVCIDCYVAAMVDFDCGTDTSCHEELTDELEGCMAGTRRKLDSTANDMCDSPGNEAWCGCMDECEFSEDKCADECSDLRRKLDLTANDMCDSPGNEAWCGCMDECEFSEDKCADECSDHVRRKLPIDDETEDMTCQGECASAEDLDACVTQCQECMACYEEDEEETQANCLSEWSC